jgi:hypothetical protein
LNLEDVASGEAHAAIKVIAVKVNNFFIVFIFKIQCKFMKNIYLVVNNLLFR